jgi:formylglycine-generating enzyme
MFYRGTFPIVVAAFVATSGCGFKFSLTDSEPPGETITNAIAMKLTLIPAGEFLMGSPADDSDAQDDEKPQRRVQITTPFYLGVTEVTQGQWQAVMGTTPWEREGYVRQGADYPATNVTWDEAQEFCRKLGRREGKTYRLPTEAEWEYACRAGTTTKYHCGDDDARLGDYAWFDKNAYDVGEKYAHAVRRKRPNPWGLYDMHGNAFEWCADKYDEHYQKTSGKSGLIDESLRMIRGGTWNGGASVCRSAYRAFQEPVTRQPHYGFRVVLSH